MKKIALAVGLLLSCGGAISTSMTGALAAPAPAIQIRPLLYQEQLKDGEVKQGVIDVANATDQPVTIVTSVQLFRQIDDEGTLEFYDKPYIQDAIKPEVKEVDLAPKEAIRIGFSVDSAKMPPGDVFAAIFATSRDEQKSQSITPAVRVGTLVILENGSSGPRHAAVTELTVPFFQTGDKLTATAKIKNTAETGESTGFFPTISTSVQPWGGATQFQGPLVYAGRTRAVDFSIPSDQFGIYKLSVDTAGGHASRYVFLITGKWRLIVPLVVSGFILLSVGVILARARRKHRLPVAN